MKSTSSQLHAGGGKGDGDEEAFEAAGQAQVHTQGTDDLLDEIDGLLETNAEEFVNSYVQKGGE
ncbi:hypothetical protein CATYP_05275 [Corynebacterium atypicum]|uniref:Prokaryotic ubiquitin-like protein Pup n=1 Tax=Corynebacterium atypicum TaxID=191610 RepID=A0ABM5QMW8_9CORY|nr:ubiquitin-like protein Pup [Corynebacterium atypicum]AIG64136.1 hypothetical protein CATYP_05275 [Corynebacterium atypicum]